MKVTVTDLQKTVTTIGMRRCFSEAERVTEGFFLPRSKQFMLHVPMARWVRYTAEPRAQRQHSNAPYKALIVSRRRAQHKLSGPQKSSFRWVRRIPEYFTLGKQLLEKMRIKQNFVVFQFQASRLKKYFQLHILKL